MISWLQITSGRGPLECCWVAAQILKCITLEADKRNIKVNLLECIPAEKAGVYKSVLLALEGESVTAFTGSWEGTIQWIGNSMFRKNHKRKNWFIGVRCFTPPDKSYWNEKEIRFERMKASGPGGQHVNKTESAVRAVHLPTGLKAVAQEERSQHLNKKLALTRLFMLLKERDDNNQKQHKEEQWKEHNQLERGNPVRVYKGKNFRLSV